MHMVSVRDLSPQKRTPHVIVRLIQVWENWNRAKEMHEMVLLFLDHQGNIIEGCIVKDRIVMFRGKLKGDMVYKIEQFMVTGHSMSSKLEWEMIPMCQTLLE